MGSKASTVVKQALPSVTTCMRITGAGTTCPRRVATQPSVRLLWPRSKLTWALA